MARTSWICTLREVELVQYLEEFDVETGGTVDEMRKRLSNLVSGVHKENTLSRLEKLESKHGRCPTPIVPGMSTQLKLTAISYTSRAGQQAIRRARCDTVTPSQEHQHIDHTQLWLISYKLVVSLWECKGPNIFFEQEEEMENMLPGIMPELVQYAALL